MAALLAVPALAVTLDIPDKQIPVRYDGDVAPFHHRVLAVQLDSARWIWITPDFEMAAVDLTGLQGLRALGRFIESPIDANPLYSFDTPLDEPAFRAAKAAEQRLAAVLGVTDLVVARMPFLDAKWIFADPAHDVFGLEASPADMGDPGRFVMRGASGLVIRRGECRFVERLTPQDVEEWRDEKRTGAGRDARLSITLGFEKVMTERQKSESFILKSTRLLQEEENFGAVSGGGAANFDGDAAESHGRARARGRGRG